MSERFVEASAVLAGAEDRVIDEAVAALGQCDQASPPCPDERRRDVRQLFRLVLRCMHAGRAEPVIRPSEQIAAHCYAAGIDLTEAQEAFNVLTEVLWRHLADALGGEQLVQALGGGCPSTSSRRCSSPPRSSTLVKPRNGYSSTT